ncbi:helix-turn-helix domain-containing protein [Streptomyces sp. NBC_01408]|uniref:helix-turn-helix domain-containing protein n=1 Tax=Streptomyces sp. NBC_01408 TaxID=2903855 RepID=UPI002258D7B1|nr:helix-turn-helix domain-containing protein [Streptomyces sp. NBC_01408]MCX4695025.1 helix-turn-helix domain-containing protein [Streptomyces sp. NBC_01408]
MRRPPDPDRRERPIQHRAVPPAQPPSPSSDRSRSDDVLRLHRLAHTGGSAALLEWLAARLGGWTGVVDTVEALGPELAVRGAAEMSARGVRSAVLHSGGSVALLFALEGGRALAAVLERPHHQGAPALLADAAVPLALVLRAEEAVRREERAALAEARAREAVLHLLMNGRLSTAHQIAGALGPSLPEPMRMYVVECPTGSRAEVTRLCEELTGGQAWIVRCPVYVRHLIVFVPAGLAAVAADHDPLAAALVGAAPDCVVGVSGELFLREAPAAYGQAFHALAVARGRDERHARFGPGPELALAAHGAGAGWARALLAPLHAYEPRRLQDPGAQELRATAHAWLNFTSHATRLLKIHRNTLAGRLRLIEAVLGLDLARLPDQAALSLALRLTPGAARPGGRGATVRADTVRADTVGARAGATGPLPDLWAALDDVLRDPGLTDWARTHLGPLAGAGAPPGARATIRTWLDHDAQLVPTAAALGISVPGARKRLTRIEAVLERSLLQCPSTRHDLWLAHRAEELAG